MIIISERNNKLELFAHNLPICKYNAPSDYTPPYAFNYNMPQADLPSAMLLILPALRYGIYTCYVLSGNR
jgi:hypothetical protein